MKKRSIDFTEPQYAFLQAEAKGFGIRVADLVRRIVDEYRERRSAIAASRRISEDRIKP